MSAARDGSQFARTLCIHCKQRLAALIYFATEWFAGCTATTRQYFSNKEVTLTASWTKLGIRRIQME